MSINILGISAYYHDSAAALLVDGKIFAAAQEERFSRKKHDARFPSNAVKYCLAEANLQLSDIDHLVFYDKPLVKFERLLETYLSYAPKGISSFISAMPIWLKEKLFLKSILKKEFSALGEIKKKIKAVKAQRQAAIGAKDKKMATIYKRRISRLKKKTRRAAA